jgi:hypothetical protein
MSPDASEIPVTADQHQVDFTLAMGEPIALALAHHGFDREASFEGPDRHDVVGLEANNSLVGPSADYDRFRTTSQRVIEISPDPKNVVAADGGLL